MRHDVTFDSGGTACAAWHFVAKGTAPRPCVVMGVGLSSTRGCQFEQFAQRLCAAGVDVLLFDYRGFGASAGLPRQVVSMAAQRADYHAAILFARSLDRVHPSRIILWGQSLAGGHVLQVAAEDSRVAGVIGVTPSVDGLASLRLAIRGNGLKTMLGLTAAGIRDAIGPSRRVSPVPVIGPRGSVAVFTDEHPRNRYKEIAGPAWRNEVAPRFALTIAMYRPIKFARKIKCPMLIQIADRDTMASSHAAGVAAWRARAEVRHYPCDHLDVLPGSDWFDDVAAHQVRFLKRHFVWEVADGSE